MVLLRVAYISYQPEFGTRYQKKRSYLETEKAYKATNLGIPLFLWFIQVYADKFFINFVISYHGKHLGKPVSP
ncbi:hypothetical protein EZS27_017697 [termite gut metagenome]|uniref:Uncharacterized protein n=1 Tax=termite gut metagenome TaxID=433724 RepID=A0A5J4RK94_9ZZZZ